MKTLDLITALSGIMGWLLLIIDLTVITIPDIHSIVMIFFAMPAGTGVAVALNRSKDKYGSN